MFEALDFLYVASNDVDASLRYYTEVLESELLWDIRDHGIRVACVKPAREGPVVLLAGHSVPGGVMLIWRVEDLPAAILELEQRGWRMQGDPFEIPPGPCCTFLDPDGVHLGIYEKRRPEYEQQLTGEAG